MATMRKSLTPTPLTRNAIRFRSAAGVSWIPDPPEVGRSLNESFTMPESEALLGDGDGILSRDARLSLSLEFRPGLNRGPFKVREEVLELAC